MKKIIAKLLQKFITRYRIYGVVGRGYKVYFKFDDMNYIALKDQKYHSITLQYWIKGKGKGKKQILSIDGLKINIK